MSGETLEKPLCLALHKDNLAHLVYSRICVLREYTKCAQVLSQLLHLLGLTWRTLLACCLPIWFKDTFFAFMQNSRILYIRADR